jgi:hypothetical protein
MTELTFFREEFAKSKKPALTNLDSFREMFMKKEKEIRADLEKAARIARELSERFRWWGTLP